VSESERITKTEYLRIIGFWGVIFMLVVFSFVLGSWNAMNTHNEIVKYCGNLVNSSVDIFGNVGIWTNPEINNITRVLP